jgi:hypothetical protein
MTLFGDLEIQSLPDTGSSGRSHQIVRMGKSGAQPGTTASWVAVRAVLNVSYDSERTVLLSRAGLCVSAIVPSPFVCCSVVVLVCSY